MSLHADKLDEQLVKDNIATARPDQTYMNTTAGSFALLGSVPPEDATMARKLK